MCLDPLHLRPRAFEDGGGACWETPAKYENVSYPCTHRAKAIAGVRGSRPDFCYVLSEQSLIRFDLNVRFPVFFVEKILVDRGVGR